MPIDEKSLVVSFSGNEEDPPLKVTEITGEYKRTEPGCFRKEGGGKINFFGGYWYIVDRLGQQVAWVEGGAKTIPPANWQTRGEGIFCSWEDIPVAVTFKFIDAPESALAKAEVGCAEAWGQCWEGLKDKIPHEHKQTVEAYEAKALEHRASFSAKAGEHMGVVTDLHGKHWPGVKDQASQHFGTAKDKYDEYAPVVKAKSKEAYGACYDFWTHPDTVDTMKKMRDATMEAVKYCFAGCAAITAGLVDQAIGKTKVEVTDNDQAMDASYIKVDSGTPVMVEHVEPAIMQPRESDAIASSL